MHARYFLESAEVIRQVPGGKDVAGMTTMPAALDEVAQSAQADVLGDQKQPMSLLTIGERGASIYYCFRGGEPLSRVARNYSQAGCVGSSAPVPGGIPVMRRGDASTPVHCLLHATDHGRSREVWI